MPKQTRTFLLALVLAMPCIEIGANLAATGTFGIAQPAEAVVGRPLTPLSVAGVGRRTVRRCRAGIYNC
jgi:hypothetical protein